VTDFLDYSAWFKQHAVPAVDERLVSSIRPRAGGFGLALDDGETVHARRVVVAAGVAPFAFRPAALAHLPQRLASHSFDHADFARFDGRRVLVVGGGQSALESAALLREAGAHVEVLVRAPRVRWLDKAPGSLGGMRRLLHELQHPPTEVGPRGLNWVAALPDLFRSTPRPLRAPLARRCIRPAGADWLRDRLAEVPISEGRCVRRAAAVNAHVRLELDDSSERSVDHVLLATGYRVDVGRYPFLSPEVVRALRLRAGYPVLSRGLETSVPGLHVVGAPAALSFGPIMRFVTGTWYAAPAVTARLLGRPTVRRRRAW
jgi:thioredoxin reductase